MGALAHVSLQRLPTRTEPTSNRVPQLKGADPTPEWHSTTMWSEPALPPQDPKALLDPVKLLELAGGCAT